MIPLTLITGSEDARSVTRDYDTTDLEIDVDFGNPLCYPSVDPFSDFNSLTSYTTSNTYGVFQGDPVYQQVGQNGYIQIDGVGDTAALNVSSGSSYFFMYNTKNSTTPKFTVEVWARFITLNNRVLLSIYPANNTFTSSRVEAFFQLALVKFPGVDTWFVRTEPGVQGSNTSNGTVSDYEGTGVSGMTAQTSLNTWKHVVFTYDGTDLQLYVNNNLIYDQTKTITSGVTDTGTSSRMGIISVPGYTSGSDVMDLAAYRYYDDHFSATRVQNNFNARKGRFGIS